MQKLLLLEDDIALGTGIRLALQNPDMQIVHCRTLASGKEEAAKGGYALMILDINLPDGSGLELLEQVRAAGNVPVMLLTAKDMETDVVAGLESGADDYVTKPFSLAILRARVNALLRRGTAAKSGCYTSGDYAFDFARMEFRKAGHSIELSKTEQRLLRLLVENRGQVLPRATLIDRIWTDGAEYVDENALSVTVKRLRDKLENTPSRPTQLKTVYGVGYMWVAP